MKVEKLDDVIKKNPKFVPEWKAHPHGGLYNPKFGSVERVVIEEDDGKILYDQYQINEVVGAVIIPYYKKGGKLYIGLITQLRCIIREPKTEKQGNVKSIEVPRGFGIVGETSEKTAIRELGEETSSVIKRLDFIGLINPNTAFYIHIGIPVFAAEVDSDKRSDFKPDAREKILRSHFCNKDEILKKIREKEIFCGISKAALLDFFVYKNMLR